MFIRKIKFIYVGQINVKHCEYYYNSFLFFDTKLDIYLICWFYLHTLQAPVSFFDTNPMGRIINRFSSDLYTIDDSLPFILNIFLAQLFGILGTVVVICYGLPWFTLLLLPLGVVYYKIQVNDDILLHNCLRNIYSNRNTCLFSLQFKESYLNINVKDKCIPKFLNCNVLLTFIYYLQVRVIEGGLTLIRYWCRPIFLQSS